MRILFCVNCLGAFGGIERVTIVKANALAAIEGNVVGICFTDKGEWPRTIHPLSSAVKVFDLNTPYWGFTSTKEFILHFMPQVMRTRRALEDVISSFSPDVVVSTGSYEKFALALCTRKGKDGKRIVKIREFHFNSNYRRYTGSGRASFVVEWFEKHVLSRFFDKSFLLTQADLRENFKNNKRFDYMYNPCSFTPASAPDYGNRKNILLAVGRIVPQKNFETLLDIWSGICRSVPGWKLRIVGGGGG